MTPSHHPPILIVCGQASTTSGINKQTGVYSDYGTDVAHGRGRGGGKGGHGRGAGADAGGSTSSAAAASARDALAGDGDPMNAISTLSRELHQQALAMRTEIKSQLPELDEMAVTSQALKAKVDKQQARSEAWGGRTVTRDPDVANEAAFTPSQEMAGRVALSVAEITARGGASLAGKALGM